MTLSGFTAYVKQLWKNKPDTSTPLSADRLTHMESGIKGNSDAIEKIAAAVVSQITNDPDKIASMAALYAVQQAAFLKTNVTGQNVNDANKVPNSALMYAVNKKVDDANSDFRIDLGHSVEHVELGGTGADGKQWISFVSADSSKVSLELWPSAISLVHYDTKTQLWSTLWTLATK